MRCGAMRIQLKDENKFSAGRDKMYAGAAFLRFGSGGLLSSGSLGQTSWRVGNSSDAAGFNATSADAHTFGMRTSVRPPNVF